MGSCSTCGLAAKWTIINGEMYEWCAVCSQQLELIETVVQATLLERRNFPPDSEYAEHEGRESGPDVSQGLPF